ncbi:MAG: hypothetical protein ACREFA_11145 [Stellaceae bacterium]
MNDLLAIDFTVLVAMSENVATDRFFVVPTRVVREALEAGRKFFFSIPRRDGKQRIEESGNLR